MPHKPKDKKKQSEPVDFKRRKFLGVSSTAAVGGIVAGLAIGGLSGYSAGQSAAPPPAAPRTITQTATQTVTTTQTTTTTATVRADRRFKAAFVYVGPIGDFGWTFAHNAGRLFAQKQLPWLDTVFLESVDEATSGPRLDTLVQQGAQMILTTSFGFMNPTAEAAARHPNVIWEHCSGFRSGAAGNAPKNMGAYFAEFYQIYYLNGLAAGAVNKTGNVGYVAAFLIPEVVRHINAFALGCRAVNPNIKVNVIEIQSWFDPTKNRQATTTLIDDKKADVIAFTEDTPTSLQVAQERQKQRNQRIWSFSHYGNMQQYGPDAHLTGQIVNWGPIYVDLINRAFAGAWETMDIWTRAGDYDPFRWAQKPDPAKIGKPEGTVYPAPLNPVVPSNIQTLIAQRWQEMKEMLFEPFTGPIKDRDGKLRLKEGQRATHDDLWTMNWFVEGVEGGTIPT